MKTVDEGTISLVEYIPYVCIAISITAITTLVAICNPSFARPVRPRFRRCATLV